MSRETGKYRETQKKCDEGIEITAARIVSDSRLHEIEKEEQEFQELELLLHMSDELMTLVKTEEPNSDDGASVIVPDENPLCLTPPPIVIFNKKNIFKLFDENSICLREFLKPTDREILFGADGSDLPEDAFRSVISYHIHECLSCEENKSPLTSLYVFYLMSVLQDESLALACFDFLKIRGFSPSVDDILTVLINLGADPTALCGYDYQVKEDRIKFDSQEPVKRKFSEHNLELIGRLLIHYLNSNLLKVDVRNLVLIRVFVKTSLDPFIRSSSYLFTTYTNLVSLVCSKAVLTCGIPEIIPWLHLKEEHLLNQIEVISMILSRYSEELFQSFALILIQHILKHGSDIAINFPLKAKTILDIFMESGQCNKSTVLEIYCFIQVIILALPYFTAAVEDFPDLGNIFTALEKVIKDISDADSLVILKSAFLKAKNILFIQEDIHCSTAKIMNLKLSKDK